MQEQTGWNALAAGSTPQRFAYVAGQWSSGPPAHGTTRRLVLACLLYAGLATGGHAADIYRWVDEQGHVHYGDCPPPDCASERVDVEPGPSETQQGAAQERLRLLREAAKSIEFPEDTAQAAAPDESAAVRWPTTCFSHPDQTLMAVQPDVHSAVTDTVRVRVERVLSALVGRWRGEMRETLCHGTETAPRALSRTSKVHAVSENRLDDGRVVLRTELWRTDTNERAKEWMWFLLDGPYLHFGRTSPVSPSAPQWIVEVLEDTSSSFTLARRRRVVGAAGSSVAHLEVCAVRASGRSVELNHWTYVHGLLTGLQSWDLRRIR